METYHLCLGHFAHRKAHAFTPHIAPPGAAEWHRVEPIVGRIIDHHSGDPQAPRRVARVTLKKRAESERPETENAEGEKPEEDE